MGLANKCSTAATVTGLGAAAQYVASEAVPAGLEGGALKSAAQLGVKCLASLGKAALAEGAAIGTEIVTVGAGTPIAAGEEVFAVEQTIETGHCIWALGTAIVTGFNVGAAVNSIVVAPQCISPQESNSPVCGKAQYYDKKSEKCKDIAK